MAQLLDIVVWRKEGASFSPYKGAQVYVYELGTTTPILFEFLDGTNATQPATINTFGNATFTGADESDTERLYLSSGAQNAEIRIVDAANGIDQTFKARAVGSGTVTLSVDASGVGVTAGAQTYDSMKEEIAQYIGGPKSTRFKDLAGIAIKGATDHLNNYDFVALVTLANIPLQASLRRYAPPSLFGKEIAGMIVSADGLTAQYPCHYVPFEDFFRALLEKTTNGGIPSYFTFDPQGSEIVIDTTPGTGAAGMILRVAYYRRIPSMANDGDTLGVDLRIEQAVKEQAIWRVKRLNRDKDWPLDEQHAMNALRTTLASQPSVDFMALGF